MPWSSRHICNFRDICKTRNRSQVRDPRPPLSHHAPTQCPPAFNANLILRTHLLLSKVEILVALVGRGGGSLLSGALLGLLLLRGGRGHTRERSRGRHSAGARAALLEQIRRAACLLLLCEVQIFVFILVGSRCRCSCLGLLLGLGLLLLLNQWGRTRLSKAPPSLNPRAGRDAWHAPSSSWKSRNRALRRSCIEAVTESARSGSGGARAQATHILLAPAGLGLLPLAWPVLYFQMRGGEA